MKYNTKIITKMLVIITSLILVLNSASYISYASDSGDFLLNTVAQLLPVGDINQIVLLLLIKLLAINS